MTQGDRAAGTGRLDCRNCHGAGYVYKLPKGANPFLMRIEDIERTSRRAPCYCQTMFPARAPKAEAVTRRAPSPEVGRMREALEFGLSTVEELRAYGCPKCFGDCAAANPTEMNCPEEQMREFLRLACAALSPADGAASPSSNPSVSE